MNRDFGTKMLSCLRHAVGVDDTVAPGRKVLRFGETYRNHFVAGGDDVPAWEIAVGLGLAEHLRHPSWSGGDASYRVSRAGFAFLDSMRREERKGVWSYETGSVYGGTITYGCPKCGVADRDTWRARAEKAEADLRDANEWRDKLADKIIELEAATSRGRELVDDANERAAQAEAQAAAMRLVLRDMCIGYPASAGRPLLAELEALRDVVAHARLLSVQHNQHKIDFENSLVKLAAVDAARKGET